MAEAVLLLTAEVAFQTLTFFFFALTIIYINLLDWMLLDWYADSCDRVYAFNIHIAHHVFYHIKQAA